MVVRQRVPNSLAAINIVVSITPVGQPLRMARNRIVQADNPQPRSGKS